MVLTVNCKWLVLSVPPGVSKLATANISVMFVSLIRQEVSTTLVKACWSELFSLGLAQCSHVMNVATILSAFVNHLHGSLQHGKIIDI